MISIVIILLLTGVQLYLISTMNSMQKADAELVNLAGRQRMLSQNIAKSALAFAMTKDQKYADQQLEAMETFDKSLNVMIDGGEIKFGDKVLNITATENAEIQKMLMEVKKSWESKQVLLMKFLNEPDKVDKTKVAELNKSSLELLALSHKITCMYQSNSAKAVENMMMIIYIILALYVAGAVFIWLFVQKSIVNPIMRTRDAARKIAEGDLS